jgi:plastocyanin
MTATRLPVVLLVVAVVALAGCGDDDDGGAAAGDAGTGGAAGGQTLKLSETDFEITPARPAVKEPGTVTFEVTNDGEVDHSLEVEGPNGEAETDTIPAGGTATLEVNLDEAGNYEMYCPIGNHRAMGMEGEVSVAGGGGGGDAEDDGGSGKGGY